MTNQGQWRKFGLAVTGLLYVCLIQEAMPIAPFYRDGLRWRRFKHDSFTVFGMDTSVYRSSMMRDSELISVSNASQQICLINLLGRVGVFVWNYVHGERRPSIEHRCILSGEQDSSNIRVRGGVFASIFRPFPYRCNVLSDVQLRPEIHIVRSVTAKVDSGHAVVNSNPFIVHDDWPSNEGHLLIRPDPRPLTLTHRVSGDYVIARTEDYEYQGQSGIDNYSPKRPFGYVVLVALFGCIFSALGFVLFNKVWSGVYLKRTMNEHLGFAGMVVSGLAMCISVLLFLHALRLFP